MAHHTCTVDGCAKPTHQGQRMCGSHFMKWYRHGDPHYKYIKPFTDLRGQRFGLLTAIERQHGKWVCQCDCGQVTTVASGDLNRGSITSCGNPKHRHVDTPTYSGAHSRVRAIHGPASQHVCVACGNQADHWSYNHDDDTELISDSRESFGLPYSTDPSHYSPRCVSCHKSFDLGRLFLK